MKFKKNSPYTGELVDEYDYSSSAEVDQALTDLSAGYLSWRKLSPTERQEKVAPVVAKLATRKSVFAEMPWNFPLWQAIRMIIPGILAGNVILLKHSEVTPEVGRLIEELFEAGQVAINDFIKSDVTLPFGGVKMSGIGRELSTQGFLEFTEMKVISSS